ETKTVAVQLKAAADLMVVGRPRNRVDAQDIVTGRKQFAMDLKVPNAWPTMVCRAPTLNGTVHQVRNMSTVKKMPGVTDVAVIPTGVAVRARTFGQCIDAVRALRVDWVDGTIGHKSDSDIKGELAAAEQALAPAAPAAKTIERKFTFA